jgi:glycosyltransferase involved in cell wall biosynthesis
VIVSPALSVVVCTYNRAHLLGGALDALVGQEPGTPPYEVIVVDNNSTDETRAVVDGRQTSVVRYMHEPVQGLSAARNTGIRAARAPVIAFTDDDVRVSSSWVRHLADLFVEHDDIEWAGGRVEPEWDAPPPGWLDSTGVAPLALVDHGGAPFVVDHTRPLCLIGANLAIRRRALDRVGLFAAEVQRVREGIGSTEDHEMQIRLIGAGFRGWYHPDLVARAVVPAERLLKEYHRRWHSGHGSFYALMRDPSFERSDAGVFFGVPAHVFRAAATELAHYVRQILRLRLPAAFAHELRLRFLLAFTRRRMFGV